MLLRATSAVRFWSINLSRERILANCDLREILQDCGSRFRVVAHDKHGFPGTIFVLGTFTFWAPEIIDFQGLWKAVFEDLDFFGLGFSGGDVVHDNGVEERDSGVWTRVRNLVAGNWVIGVEVVENLFAEPQVSQIERKESDFCEPKPRRTHF